MGRVFLPRGLSDLWHIREEQPAALLYAGGTDLLVRLRASQSRPPALICLERIGELRSIRESDGRLWIGACTTHTELLESPLVRQHLPLLVKAVRTLGSPPIRNMGTIGGNICTASPAGDTLTPLYALDAEVELLSQGKSRMLPLGAFIQGPGKTTLAAGEILGGVWVRRGPPSQINYFEKVGQRKALAIAVASLAASVTLAPDGVIQEARLAWGSMAPTVVRSPEVERLLTGRTLSRESLAAAVPLVERAVSPIDDIRGSAAYRRLVAGNLLYRLLSQGTKSEVNPP
jgi:CO/xanthine dehydrogenase FAD-binding subunit